MAKKKESEEEIYPPYWISKDVIKTLPKEKQGYWKNRLKGKRGQGEEPKKVVKTHPSEVTTSFDNAGQIVVHNREARRARPHSLNIFTKATQSIKKERPNLNDKQKRTRAAAKARKARKARNPQVS